MEARAHRVVIALGVTALATIASGCGHNRVSEQNVRAAVIRFVNAPKERVQFVSGPLCEKDSQTWQCVVGVRIPDDLNAPTLRGSSVSLTTSCTTNRCEVTSVKSSKYGPTNVRWTAVITDWLDGGINHKHSCAAVKAAILRLPTDSLTYSTVNDDLAAYESKACRTRS